LQQLHCIDKYHGNTFPIFGTDAPQGGKEHAPVADMGGLSTLSAAASKRILEDGDPALFGSGSE